MVLKKNLIFALSAQSLYFRSWFNFSSLNEDPCEYGSKTALELFKSKTLGTDIENILSTSLHMPTMFNDFFVYRRSSSPLLLLTG